MVIAVSAGLTDKLRVADPSAPSPEALIERVKVPVVEPAVMRSEEVPLPSSLSGSNLYEMSAGAPLSERLTGTLELTVTAMEADSPDLRLKFVRDRLRDTLGCGREVVGDAGASLTTTLSGAVLVTPPPVAMMLTE